MCVCGGGRGIRRGGGAGRTFTQTRDTAFRSLRELTSGDRIARKMATADEKRLAYHVIENTNLIVFDKDCRL